MRPIYSQLAVIAVLVGIAAIVVLYHRANVLKAQIEKAENKTPRPITNPTGTNTPFKPQNPSA